MMKKGRKFKMVCLNEPRSDSNVVTRFLRPSERVQTTHGNIGAQDWLEREKSRFERSGVRCEIVQTQAGRIALRKTRATD